MLGGGFVSGLGLKVKKGGRSGKISTDEGYSLARLEELSQNVVRSGHCSINPCISLISVFLHTSLCVAKSWMKPPWSSGRRYVSAVESQMSLPEKASVRMSLTAGELG